MDTVLIAHLLTAVTKCSTLTASITSMPINSSFGVHLAELNTIMAEIHSDVLDIAHHCLALQTELFAKMQEIIELKKLGNKYL